MSPNQDDREKYHALIQQLYGEVINSSPSQIDENVVDVINTILNSAVECSKAVAITPSLIQLLFPSASAIQFTVSIVRTGFDAISSWIEASQDNQIAISCLESAKINWRSTLEMALLGI